MEFTTENSEDSVATPISKYKDTDKKHDFNKIFT